MCLSRKARRPHATIVHPSLGHPGEVTLPRRPMIGIPPVGGRAFGLPPRWVDYVANDSILHHAWFDPIGGGAVRLDPPRGGGNGALVFCGTAAWCQGRRIMSNDKRTILCLLLIFAWLMAIPYLMRLAGIDMGAGEEPHAGPPAQDYAGGKGRGKRL